MRQEEFQMVKKAYAWWNPRALRKILGWRGRPPFVSRKRKWTLLRRNFATHPNIPADSRRWMLLGLAANGRGVDDTAASQRRRSQARWWAAGFARAADGRRRRKPTEKLRPSRRAQKPTWIRALLRPLLWWRHPGDIQRADLLGAGGAYPSPRTSNPRWPFLCWPPPGAVSKFNPPVSTKNASALNLILYCHN